MQEKRLSATAIQCWTALEEFYGVVPCTLMSMMSNTLMPSACETDIAGLVGMYVLQAASGQPAALLDWNNNYGEDPNKGVVFHCSNLPKAFFGEQRMDYQEIIAGTVGKENTYGTIVGRIAPGPFTYCRVSTDDFCGRVDARTSAKAASPTTSSTPSAATASSRCRTSRGCCSYICRNGFEHHVAATKATVADAVEDALDTYLEWDVYRHEAGATDRTRRECGRSSPERQMRTTSPPHPRVCPMLASETLEPLNSRSALRVVTRAQMPRHYTIGLDYGTNSVRALIVDVANGREVGTAVWNYAHGDARASSSSRDPNLARQHPGRLRQGRGGHDPQGARPRRRRTVRGFTPDQVIGIGVDTTGSTPLPGGSHTAQPLAFDKRFASEPGRDGLAVEGPHRRRRGGRDHRAGRASMRPQYLAKCGGTYSQRMVLQQDPALPADAARRSSTPPTPWVEMRRLGPGDAHRHRGARRS